MNTNTTAGGPLRIASAGHVAFALMMIVLGILGLIKRDFTVVWQPVPNGVPAREVLAYLTALVCLGAGVSLFWRRMAPLAARVLLAFFVLWFLLWRIRPVILVPGVPSTWSCGQTLVMMAAAWVLFAWFATDWDRQHLAFATGEKGLRVAQVLYGLGLIPFGVAHFIYVKETVVLIPSWLPWHTGWAYFTGATFIVAGVAMIIGVFGRLAATLSALQMGLFGLIVWIPLVMFGSLTPFQWGEFVSGWALTAAGWVLADSYRGTPWLAARRRNY